MLTRDPKILDTEVEERFRPRVFCSSTRGGEQPGRIRADLDQVHPCMLAPLQVSDKTSDAVCW